MREIQDMRIIVLLLVLLFSPVAFAQAVDAPQMTFEQRVNVVVTVKKDPRVFEMTIDQEKDKVVMTLIIDQKQDRDQATVIANNAIMTAKIFSLDDKPKEKDVPGKGILDYEVVVTRPDGVVLVTAFKVKAKDKLTLENPFPPAMEPLTRAGAAGR